MVTGTRLYPSCDITNDKSITLVAAIAIITLVLAVRHPFYFITPAGILAKVYSNSMMVVLNSRMRISADAHLEANITITRLRSDNPTHGTDVFELGEGILVTREEMVFPCNPNNLVDGTGSQMNKSSYVV